MRESYCVRVCFTSKSKVENFSSAVMNSGWSARRRWAVAPPQDPGPTWRNKIAASLNESRSVSDRSAPLVAAETLNDKPDVVWSERTTAAVDTGGFCPTGAAVARAWYRWCAGQGKQVFDSASIANRDKYHPHFGELLHYLLSLYAFEGLVRRILSQRRPCAARSTSSRFAAGPSGAERT